MDRTLRIVSLALITAGIVILADVATTLLWQEPASSLYASVQQHNANAELSELEQESPTSADLRAARRVPGISGKVRTLAGLFAQRVDDGQAIGRVVIPSIDVDIVMVQGTNTDDLAKGPGHYSSTPFPGQLGTTAIAGHRTTYLAPFRHLDSLDQGDTVQVEMPYATLDYRIEKTRVVQPTDVGILRRASHQRLVLTACHPLYSASERIVAFARLARIRSVPPGAMRSAG